MSFPQFESDRSQGPSDWFGYIHHGIPEEVENDLDRRKRETGESFKHTEYNTFASILSEHVHKLSNENILKFSFLLEEYPTVPLFLFFSLCPKCA